MKYPKLLTIKSTDAINRTASRIAQETGRTRSAFIKDLIITLADNETLRQAVNEAINKG